jgi:hypothetical protein
MELQVNKVADSCEYGNEASASTKGWEFSKQWSDY